MIPQWYYIPPPYDQSDAIHLQGPPAGAKRTYSVKPRETVQIIGSAKAVVPRLVTKDLGWVDLRIIDGSRIEFAAGGLGTDVGTRDPSTTLGMSMKPGGKVAPRGRVVSASPSGVIVPEGSLVWASGTTGKGVSRVQRVRWYYQPPPYTGEVIPLPGPPYGVTDPKGTDPLSTVQIVGRSRKAIPPTRVDLGFAVIGVAKDNVEEVVPRTGQTEPSPRSQRPSVPKVEPTEAEIAEQVRSAVAAEQAEKVAAAAPLEEPDEESVLEPKGPKTRVDLPKKVTRGKKPLTEDEYMTTLKGFDPYTFEGM